MIRVLALPQHVPHVQLVARVWIWSLRHWVLAKRNGAHVPVSVWRTLDGAWQSSPTHREMTAIWSELHAGARKSIVIRSPSNETMSTDEQMLVAALSAARVQVPDVVRWFLADLLRADALDVACRRFAVLGARARALAATDDHHTIDIDGTDLGTAQLECRLDISGAME